MTSQFIAAAASIALLGTGLAAAEGTRSFEAVPMQQTTLAADGQGGGNKCRVDVIRNGTPGTADITRLVENDGTCVCTVTTGVANENGQAEAIVGALLRDRTCDGAPAPGGKAAAFGPSGLPLWPLLAAPAAAGGLAAGVGSDSKG